MRRLLLVLSAASAISLLVAQLGTYLEFELVPAPTSATSGPQGPEDLLFGLMSLTGGGLGLISAVGTGIVGLAVAYRENRRGWLIAIATIGAVVVAGFAVSAFVMLGLQRNAYHPLTICLLVPLATLSYLAMTRRR